VKHKLDEEALEAARAFLLGKPRLPESRGTTGREPPKAMALEARPTAPVISESPPPSLGSEPTPIELSATDIRRTSSGWRARCIHKRGVDSRHVNDARYGGYVKSFIEAMDVRDRFCRGRGLPIPWEIEAIVDGVRVAPEVEQTGRRFVVRWQGQEHVVTGADAQEIATEIALDLFVEYLDELQRQVSKKAI
jgi:hypothetical protein